MTATVPPVTVDLTVPQPLERGSSLPAEWYTRPDIFALGERERIFNRFWQYAGYTEQVARPGDFFTSTLGTCPSWSCARRRRRTRLRQRLPPSRLRTRLRQAGSRKTIQCHYHGWTWNLNGSLRAAPRCNEQPAFGKDEFPLVALQAETWGPMIFVNADPQAAHSAARWASPCTSSRPQASISARCASAAPPGRHNANWKVVVENYNECYHCPIAHPSFADLIDMDTYKVVTAYEWFSIQHGVVRDAAKEGKGDGIYDVGGDKLSEGVHEGCFSMIFPATMLVINPGPHNLGVLPSSPSTNIAQSSAVTPSSAPRSPTKTCRRWSISVGRCFRKT